MEASNPCNRLHENGSTLLLALLFVYDVTWVFGTDVMVTVAKGIDGPVKLLFGGPSTTRKKLLDARSGRRRRPGPLPRVTIALRRGPEAPREAVLPFYVTSLLLADWLTLYVMFRFDAAQPALLYLVPACLGAAAFVGLCRGEFSQFASYSEEEEQSSNGAVAAEASRQVAEARRVAEAAAKRAASPRRSTRIASQ